MRCRDRRGRSNSGDPTTAENWAIGQATTSTLDVDLSGTITTGDITRTTRYDADGQVIQTRQPKSNGSDAGATNTVYYRAGTGSGDAACDNKPQWAGLECARGPAAAPSSGPTMPTARTTAYTWDQQPATVVETSGTANRTTTTSYGAGDTPAADQRTTLTITGSGAGQTVPAISYNYDPATGAPTRVTESLSGTYTQTGYDAWGRPVTYRNSLGETTTRSYVPPGSEGAGQLAQTVDATGYTTTYQYGTDANGAVDHRGLPTGMTTTDTGLVRAAYNADGAITVQALPGLTQTRNYDSSGHLTAMTYDGTITDPDTGATSTGTWLSWAQTHDPAGRVRQEWTPAGQAYTDGDAVAYDRLYTYTAGRLTRVQDRNPTGGAGVIDPTTPASLTSACVTRVEPHVQCRRRCWWASVSLPTGW